MRTLLSLLAMAVVMGCGSAVRAEPDDDKRPGREEMRKRFMEKFDKNKNGKIDEDEKAAIRAEFAKRREHHRHDADGKRDSDRKRHSHHKRDADGKRDSDRKRHSHHRHDAHRKHHSRSAHHTHHKHKGHHKHHDRKGRDKKQRDRKKPDVKKGCPKAEECPKAKECPAARDAKKKPGKCPGGDAKVAKAGRHGHPHWHGHHNWEEMKKKILKKFDANKNGKIDDDEKEAIRKAHHERVRRFMAKRTEQGAAKIMGELDKNDDGKLNADEVPEKHRKNFGRADKNHDGYIDKGELEAVLTAVRQKMISEFKRRMEEHRKKQDK